MNQRPSAIAHAESLGATISGGINWTWANGFRTPQDGQDFVAWLNANGYEHRGYYAAQPDSLNPNLHLDGVRFR